MAEEEDTKLEPHFPTTKEAIFDAISCAMSCVCRISKRYGVGEWLQNGRENRNFLQFFFSISPFSNVTRDVAKYVQPWPCYLNRDGQHCSVFFYYTYISFISRFTQGPLNLWCSKDVNVLFGGDYCNSIYNWSSTSVASSKLLRLSQIPR